jgi:hypothetical protein
MIGYDNINENGIVFLLYQSYLLALKKIKVIKKILDHLPSFAILVKYLDLPVIFQYSSCQV